MTDAFPKLRLNPELLTPRDLKRAKVALDGQNPWELLGTDDAITLTIWCLRSREDPGFTWDDALDTPLGEFELDSSDDSTDEGETSEPPPTPGPVSNGSGPGANASSDEKPTVSVSTPRRRSATSSG